jgi:hypothetical protein
MTEQGTDRRPQPYRFVFITGIEGSGTTMFSRILAWPTGVVGLGGNHVTVPRSERDAFRLVRAFNDANERCWDRHATATEAAIARRQMRELVDQLLELPAYRDTTHAIYKRSAPFKRERDRFRPDLLDLDMAFDDACVLLIYRDPRASTASALRRSFFDEVRRAAVTYEEQLTYLDAQLGALDPERSLVVSYEQFCRDPASFAGALASLTGLSENDLKTAISEESPDPGREQQWRTRLDDASVEFLDGFFDERRCRQWPRLDAARLAHV